MVKIQLEDAILELCAARGAEKSICPTDAAKAYALARGDEDPLAWRSWLHHVRGAAASQYRLPA